MWLYFNNKGQLIKSLEHGNPARAGSTDFKIFAVFENIDTETKLRDYSATIKLIKPDLYNSAYPTLLMQSATAVFELQDDETNDNIGPFQNGSTYYGFLFDFSDFDYGAEEEYILLDTQGLWNAVITVISTPIEDDVYNVYNVYNVQGVASFNVGGVGTPDPTDTSIYDVVTNQLVAEINKRALEIETIIVLEFSEIDMNKYLEGQMFYASDRHKLYQIVGDEIVQIPFILNIEDGSGTGAVQGMKDGSGGTFDFTNKNPNATALDPTLTGSIAYGGVGNYSASFGGKSQASGKRSFAQGTTTVAKGNYSHAEGDNSVALGNDSHAEGQTTVSAGVASHSEGHETQAIGNNAHSEGYQTNAYSAIAHSEGVQTTVKDNYIIVDTGEIPEPVPTPTPEPSTDEQKDAVNGMGAHSEGHSTYVLGCGAHAEGDTTKAYGRFSHSEGRSTIAGELIVRKTEDSKDYYTPNQNKQFQHAEGESTHAIGHASHTGGLGTIANYDYQTVVGIFNDNKSDTLFEVGNGNGIEDDANEKRNAFEVHSDGRASVSAEATNNMDVVTFKQMSDRYWTHLIALTPTESDYPFYLLRIVNKRKTAYSSVSDIVSEITSALSICIMVNNGTLGIPDQRLLFIDYDGTNLKFFDANGTVTTKTKTAVSIDLVSNY